MNGGLGGFPVFGPPGFGGFPGMPGGSGGQSTTVVPNLPCTAGPSHLPLHVIIDTGAQVTLIDYSAFQRCFASRVVVDTSKTVSATGIGGATMNLLGRFNMVLNINVGGREGEVGRGGGVDLSGGVAEV